MLSLKLLGKLHERVGVVAMIKLRRSNSARNMQRFYSLQVAPTLFGEWGVVAEWGRIGSPGRVQERVFESEQAAEAALSKRLRIRTRRGYIRASWEAA
jgi:predicted DNA-binding WGR domain protein